VLARNGVETEIIYPQCCGMPLLEQGRIAEVAQAATTVAAALRSWIDKGYDIIALVPSCALMLKFEWPLIVPEDCNVAALAKATFDLSEYVVDIARKEGLAPGLAPVASGGVALHVSCHSRAQNMGQKARDMLKLIPNTDLQVIERCSGHGGANFATALKVGAPVAKQVAKSGKAVVSSECPLAGAHIAQELEKEGGQVPRRVGHPIEILAQAYGLR